MNGKKGSNIKIDINLGFNNSAVTPEHVTKQAQSTDVLGWSSSKKWIHDVLEFAKEDTNRVTFALKVGLAVLLVSVLILFRAPYEVFGTNIIWSILTVAIMFEYTVGATFNRGFNRAVGSLVAGVFAIVVIQVAMSCGHVAEPYVIGFSIFLVGAVTSFMKLWPSLVQYEYGFRVVLFTFCLLIVSGFRMGDPIRIAMDRLYSIAIGAFVALFVNVFIFPIWSGEQLHKELVASFKAVADSLEECVNKYLSDDTSFKERAEYATNNEFPDEPAFKKCKSTLDSSTKLESMASSAAWEPPHGRFRHFFYPWAEYIKVGAVLRHCAYEVMALNGCLHSEIQAPYNLRYAFQSEILEATKDAAKLIRSLADDISNMKHVIHSTLIKQVHNSTERLQQSIEIHSYLLTSTPHHVNSLNHSIIDSNSKLSSATSLNLKELTTMNGVPLLQVAEEESYHERMKKQQRRLYSWPSREVDYEFEQGRGGGGGGVGDVNELFNVPKMKTLESTAALSLTTFTSLLIEVVARLDHLVTAVDVLAKMANFKQDFSSKV